jgi:protein-S-isoprenylcysteine O-methyltransferase Ste14
MSTLRTVILLVWAAFWLYWLVSAASAKTGTRRAGRRPVASVIFIVALVLLRKYGGDVAPVHALGLQVLGVVLLLAGLGLAVWARVHLGRNWGMPMTEKDEPELITSGPYRFVRHPIYSGLLLGFVGTAVATNVLWLAAVAIVGPYFVFSARVEERNLTRTFPGSYPGYRAHTKMLIPFVL